MIIFRVLETFISLCPFNTNWGNSLVVQWMRLHIPSAGGPGSTPDQGNRSHLLQLRRRRWHPTPVPLPGKSHGQRSLVGCNLWGLEELDTTEWLHFHFHALEKEMATHSSVLAWRIPRMAEPGGLPPMGSHRVGHDWSDLAAAAAAATKDPAWCNEDPECHN